MSYVASRPTTALWKMPLAVGNVSPRLGVTSAVKNLLRLPCPSWTLLEQRWKDTELPSSPARCWRREREPPTWCGPPPALPGAAWFPWWCPPPPGWWCCCCRWWSPRWAAWRMAAMLRCRRPRNRCTAGFVMRSPGWPVCSSQALSTSSADRPCSTRSRCPATKGRRHTHHTLLLLAKKASNKTGWQGIGPGPVSPVSICQT